MFHQITSVTLLDLHTAFKRFHVLVHNVLLKTVICSNQLANVSKSLMKTLYWYVNSYGLCI